MQINNIRAFESGVADNELRVGGEALPVRQEHLKGAQSLRELRLNHPFYDKSTVTQQMQNLMGGALHAQDAVGTLRNEMTVASMNMDDADLARIRDCGLSAKDMAPEEFVDIADKIRVSLAKGGADLSLTGGLSRDDIAAVSGDESYAALMENELNDAGGALDSFDKNVADTSSYEDLMGAALSEAQLSSDRLPDCVEALRMAEELRVKASGGLSEDAVKSLLRNDPTPSIDNLYHAVFSSAGGTSDLSVNVAVDGAAIRQESEKRQQEELPEDMRKQIALMLEGAGIEPSNAAFTQVSKMLSEDIPVTGESLLAWSTLKQFSMEALSTEDVAVKIADTLLEGKSAEETNLLAPTLMQQARELFEDFQNMPLPSDVAVRRNLEEIRLSMTVQANFVMLKNGIGVDTSELSALVDELKAQEEALARGLFAGDGVSAEVFSVEECVSIFMETTETANAAKELPAAVLGLVSNASLRSIRAAGEPLRAELSEANVPYDRLLRQASLRYDSMQTEVRRDLGDSLQKAFRNVDDILSDLGLSASDSNERAVRILAYNKQELSAENISAVKNADEAMQRAFKNLTPGVVAELIRRGDNPLDLSIDELNRKAEEIKSVLPASREEERFSRFLRRLDETNGISPEERSSFLGVFRLIHQVDKADGAQIGLLLQNGQDITMRNLMMATRTRKAENREFTVDDSFGLHEGFDRETLSITQQIEMAFQTNCIRDAGELLSPAKLQQFDGEDAYLNLSPEEFAGALEEMEAGVFAGVGTSGGTAGAGTSEGAAGAGEAGVGRTSGDTAGAEERRAADLAAYEKEIDRRLFREDLQEIREAVSAEPELYRMLDSYDIPQSPANLQAFQALLQDRNSAFSTLLKARNERKVDASLSPEDIFDITIDDLIDEAIEDYGEAVKTPADMAEAQRKLAETAENVMRDALLNDGIAPLDVRAMKLMNAQISLFGSMMKSETYNIPVTVADQAGNMTVKIVRGEEQKGLVDIVFSSEATGNLRAGFRVEKDNIEGNILTDSAEAREVLAEQAALLAAKLQEAAGMSVSLNFALEHKVEVNGIYGNTDPGFAVTSEQEPVQTRTLYGIARAFVDGVREMV